MARQRRGGGFRPPELKGTLGTLIRTTLQQAGVVRDALERGAREGRSRIDEAFAGRRRQDALAELGELVLDLIRRGEIDLDELPEAQPLVRALDELDADSEDAGARDERDAGASRGRAESFTHAPRGAASTSALAPALPLAPAPAPARAPATPVPASARTGTIAVTTAPSPRRAGHRHRPRVARPRRRTSGAPPPSMTMWRHRRLRSPPPPHPPRAARAASGSTTTTTTISPTTCTPTTCRRRAAAAAATAIASFVSFRSRAATAPASRCPTP